MISGDLRTSFIRSVVGCLFALVMAFAARDAWAVVTVSGTIRYQGAVGNEGDDLANALGLFPVRGALVQLWDENTAAPGHAVVAETYTNDDGSYSFEVSNAETSLDPSSGHPLDGGTADFFLRILAQSRPQLPVSGGIATAYRVALAGPLDASFDDTLGPIYAHLTPSTLDVAAGYTFDHDFDAGSDLDHAFSAFDALTSATRHYSDLTGNVETTVVALFPTHESTSNFSESRLHLLGGDRFDWDVATHEFAHNITSLHPGIDNSPGNAHSSRDNLRFSRPDLNRVQANRLAWSEGFATYFGQAAQASQHVSAFGIQRTDDAIYHDNDDADGVSIASGNRYGIEDATVGGRPSRGEDNEATVARILLDLTDDSNDAADRDRVALGADKVWRILTSASAPVDTLDRFWDVLVASPGVTNADIVDYGAIFQAHNVSPRPDTTSVHGAVPGGFLSDPPTFRWDIPQGGSTGAGFTTNLLNDFGIKVFTDSLALEVYDSGLLGNVAEWTPGTFAWSSIAGFPGSLKWIVYGIARSTEAEPGTTGATFTYESGPFWSDAVSFDVTVVPEPNSLVLAVIAFAAVAPLRKRRAPLAYRSL